MNNSSECQSCGMTIDSGIYCTYCTDEAGQLQPFEERYERMLQWELSENPDMPHDIVEKETKVYMRKMPAWRYHPKLQPDIGEEG